MKKAAFYGLAGNPPHRGHWGCVRDLVQRGYFVTISPSAGHAFGKTMAPYERRLEWLRLGADDFCADLEGEFLIWDGEMSLKERLGTETVYSIDALRALKSLSPNLAYSLAVGPDNADPDVFARFKEHELIERDFGVVVTPNQGNIRSTQIRASLESLHSGRLDILAKERHLNELRRAVGPAVSSALESLGFSVQGGYGLTGPAPKP